MRSTDGRSRDEWLAVVRERGEQLRRRRRLALSAVGAVALLLPALALASVSLGGNPAGQVQLAAEGPAPATGGPDSPVVGGGDLITTTTALTAAPGSTPPAEPLFPTTTIEVHLRVDAVNGRQGPPTPTTRVVDDPVIRPPAAGSIGPGANANGTTVSAANSGATAVTTTAPPGEPALAACPVADVRVTVSTDKATYAPGETVRFSSTLENRSATTCLVSGRAFFSIENGAGATVSDFAYTANFMLPVKAEPGQTFTNSGTWDQRDCSGSACVQAPAGPYAVVAGWTEAGPYTGRGSFQISA